MEKQNIKEKAREMFDERFGRLLSNRNPDEFVFVENEVKDFIDQIITLVIEEKIKVIEQLAHNETGLMPEMGIFDSGYELAKEDVIKILKQ